MKIENGFEVPIPPHEAWTLLTDVARVAPCLPGATLSEAVDADTYRGELAVKLGPVGMSFVGEMRFVERDPGAGLVRAAASAREARNRGTADAAIEFRLAPAGDGTRVDIVTDLTLSGQAAQYGRSAGVVSRVSGFMIGRFAECLRKRLIAGDGGPGGGGAA